VSVVTRRGCHLCEDAESVVDRLSRELGFSWDAVDVDQSSQLQDAYGDRVPVILLDGVEHGYWRVEEDRLRRALDRPAPAL
jgi:glutaredoxin